MAGILFSYTFGAFTKYVPFCLMCAVWALLHLVGALCIPESPYFLTGKDSHDRAAASLNTLRDHADTAEELAAIKVRRSNEDERTRGQCFGNFGFRIVAYSFAAGSCEVFGETSAVDLR